MNTNYAGFWKRFCATFLDGIITQIVVMVLALFFSFMIRMSGGGGQESVVAFGVIGFMLPWIYYAAMESSCRQATFGKMALGIKVASMEGERVSFGTASGRYFGKIISALILFVGFLMIAFTKKKQGLHDMMAECLVLDGEQPPQLLAEPRSKDCLTLEEKIDKLEALQSEMR